MNRTVGLLFPTALGLSAVMHLLALFLWPYSPAQPAQGQPEPIPVRLLEAPRLPPLPPAAPRRQAAPIPPAARPEPKPIPPEPVPRPEPEPKAEPETQAARAPLELAPPESAAAGEEMPNAGVQAESGLVSASVGQTVGNGASALAAEITATQAVLSSLRARIVEKIRYPPLARANGWKGTVLLELLLDESGRLQGLAVRRSSGYAVLDRAAAALVRSVTPVENLLGRPLRIEVPIAYELKD